VTKLDNENVLE